MSRLTTAFTLAFICALAPATPAHARKNNGLPTRLELPRFEISLKDADGEPVRNAKFRIGLHASGERVNDCYLNVGTFFECVGAGIIYGSVDMHFKEFFSRELSVDWYSTDDEGAATHPVMTFGRVRHDKLWVPDMDVKLTSMGVWPFDHPTRPGLELQCERVYWGPMYEPFIRVACDPGVEAVVGANEILEAVSEGIDCRLTIGTQQLQAWHDRGTELCREKVLWSEESNGPWDPREPVVVYPNDH